jgi:GxxExxY protein
VDINELTHLSIGAAIRVHRGLGPGLLESVYEACLYYELIRQNITVERQRPLRVAYDSITLDCGYRIDLLVDDRVIVEVKSVKGLDDIHTAQILTYLKLSKCTVGLVINFNVLFLKSGIRRVVNHHLEPSPRPQRPLR